MIGRTALILAAALAAATASASATTTLHILGASTSAGMQALVKSYMDAHPDIQITLDAGDLTKLATMVAAGTPPDMAWMGDGQVETWVKQDDLVSLDPVFKGIGAKLDVIPTVKQLATVDGQLYFLPLETGTWGLFYNRKLFDAAAQEYPTRAWTWSNFRSAAKKLTVRDATGKVSQYGHQAMDPFWWGYWVQLDEQAGGSIVSDDFHTAFPQLDPLVQAFQFAWDVTWVDRSAPTPADGTRFGYAIENNNLGMYWHLIDTALAFKDKIDPSSWGVSAFPKADGEGGRHAVQTYTTGIAIVKGSKHIQEDAQFLAYLNSSSAQRILFEHDNKLPVSQTDLVNWLLEPGTLTAEHLPQSFAQLITIMQDDSDFLPGLTDFDNYTGAVETEYVALLNSNSLSPKEVATTARQKAQAILDKDYNNA